MIEICCLYLFFTAGIGPSLSTENLLQSIAAALHLNNQPLTGQTVSKAALHKNPGVHLNTEQPLVQVRRKRISLLFYNIFSMG